MTEDIASDVWLGDYPQDWKKTRIKRVCRFAPSFSNGKPGPEDKCTVVPMEAVSEHGEVSVGVQEPYGDIIAGLNLFENGDVLFAKITPCMENGKGAFVEHLTTPYAFGSTEFHVLRPDHKVDGRFLYYVTFNPTFRAWAEKNMYGAAGQQRVSARFLKYTRLPLPPHEEQKRIASYLDASCMAIDRAVETKQKQLEILDTFRKSIIQKAVTQGINPNVELKDSGVGWLGQIPRHWQCESLKRNANRIQTGTTPPTSTPEYFEEGTIPWFAPECFGKTTKLGEPKKMINELALQDNKLRIFPSGTVFFVGIGATIGKVAILNEAGSANQQIVGIECSHRMLGQFLAYQLKNYEGIIPRIAQFTTLPILNQTKVGYLPVLRPPISEQYEICAYVDRKEVELSKIEGVLLAQITTLTNYRKSLIHECVTGKRRITEADLAKVGADV
jgi:type I restriction enzyme S subunit